MENFDRKAHWNNIYQTKDLKDVSWFQPRPETSLSFFKNFNVPLTAKIIDIGGGDSLLADHLLKLGYQNISVLDISAAAIDKAKERLGNDATKVNWIITDITAFEPTEKYDFWHDRAAFHFLTNGQDIATYLATAHKSITDTGVLVMGTFSELGPTTCSGIPIKQYTEETLTTQFSQFFEKKSCINIDHQTPSGSLQNFIFCSFRKKCLA